MYGSVALTLNSDFHLTTLLLFLYIINGELINGVSIEYSQLLELLYSPVTLI